MKTVRQEVDRSERCGCGRTRTTTFIDIFDGVRRRTHGSTFCAPCGLRAESDWDGPPQDVRAELLGKYGSWELHVDRSIRTRALAAMRRTRPDVPLAEFMAEMGQDGPLLEGTEVEVAVLAAELARQDIPTEARRLGKTDA